MKNLDVAKLNETVAFIQSKINTKPQAGIILGSGLGGLVNDLQVSLSLNYEEIPNFPTSTVKGHGGKLLFGQLNGKEVVMLSGRFHYYEGYTMQEVTFPVRVMKQLGCELLMVSNAAGGMNKSFKVGDLMIINDHTPTLKIQFRDLTYTHRTTNLHTPRSGRGLLPTQTRHFVHLLTR